jgi:hypothetical protein
MDISFMLDDVMADLLLKNFQGTVFSKVLTAKKIIVIEELCPID